GAFGSVYEARDADGERVAVKVLYAADEQMVARFRREVGIAASLTSPHVLRAIDHGFDPEWNAPYLVMPLCTGLDLSEQIERLGPLQPTVVARLVRQLCLGLADAHDHGVVHRDLKPANIYLDHDLQGAVTVRVLDFGVAKLRQPEQELTATTAILGSPLYMSPEQLTSSRNVEAISDVWSVGVTMYEALTGATLFPEVKTLADLFISTTQKDAPHLQERAPWVEAGLATIVHACLLREPDRRCPDVRTLHDALEPFAQGSDELQASMLEPLADEVRAYRAPRASLPSSWAPDSIAHTEKAVELTVADEDPFLGTRLADRYTLVQCLGRGGMGAVYEARDADDAAYAVKVIIPEAAAKASVLRRFVREARASMRLDHPHVVKVYEADAAGPQPFIVMEMLQGRDLAGANRIFGVLPPRVVARLFLQACRGLKVAHEQGLVHRDIKPANLFLHELPSGEVQLKVCDFGVVKDQDHEGSSNTVTLTRAGGMVGSPQFMSPEQARGMPIDHRTDIWSLGVSLFE
ncbi:MAG: serine/threonine-protein kinase, partial [Myxococcota bacterium]